MQVSSVLYQSHRLHVDEKRTEDPSCFCDLGLDRFEDAVAQRGGDDLRALVRRRPDDPDSVVLRQGVFRDIECSDVRHALRGFGESVRLLRRRLRLVHGMGQRAQQHRWFLDVADEYVQAVTTFSNALTAAGPDSPALRLLSGELQRYTESSEFAAMTRDLVQLRRRFSAVRFTVSVTGDDVCVTSTDPAHAADHEPASKSTPHGGHGLVDRVVSTFSRFTTAGSYQPPTAPAPEPGLDDLESQILDAVAELHPGPFAAAAQFYDLHHGILGPSHIATVLDRELRFYLAVHDHCEQVRSLGLPMCLPQIAPQSSGVDLRDAYDLVLAHDLAVENRDSPSGRACVTNDVVLAGTERILVVTGPNRSGKTTLARALGQIAYLTMLGCPVPAHSAHLPLPDTVLTVFAGEERADSPVGRLHAELADMRRTLDHATERSVVIINEILASTTVEDGTALGRRLMADLADRGAVSVWVTFLDELADFDDRTVSLVGLVDGEDPQPARTHRFVRGAADGRAYAHALAGAHGLTRDQIVAAVRANSPSDRVRS